MNPNDIDFNDPKIQKAFQFFQQQQFQQMMFQQQQQQIMMQQQFMQQQMWNEFQQFCGMRGLNPSDQNALNLYWQFKNNMNNTGVGGMNINPQQQQQQQQMTNSTNLSQQTVYISSEVQPPRGDNVYINQNQSPQETIPRLKKTLYVNENEFQNNQNNFMKFGMSSSTDIVNVTLTATSGLKVVIPAQKSMPLCQLFKNYVKKVGVPESVIGTKIVFLFNAEKLDANSTQPISNFFKSFNANITVLDQANIIGA